MSKVTKEMVFKLREMTGAWIMDCKKALCATNCDFDEAKEWLKKHSGAVILK